MFAPTRKEHGPRAAVTLVVAAATVAAAEAIMPVTRAMPPSLPHARVDQAGIERLTIPVDADTTLASDTPDQAGGGEPLLRIGSFEADPADPPGADATYAVLVRFPLTTLPAGATVVTAALRLSQVAAVGQASLQGRAAPVTEAWGEAAARWSNRPAVDAARRASLTLPAGAGPVVLDVTDAVRDRDPSAITLSLELAGASGACDAGRSRAFASREGAAALGAAAPALSIAYFGAGTPHPFPSPTATPTRTATPTATPSPTVPGTPRPTATPTATASATPTSNRPPLGRLEPVEPMRGARLAPPVGVDRWVFRWRWIGLTTFCQRYELVLRGPSGQTIAVPVGATASSDCATYAVPGPPGPGHFGAWTWELTATCLPLGTGRIDPVSFTVVGPATATAGPTVTPAATREPTATRVPPDGHERRFLPWSRGGR